MVTVVQQVPSISGYHSFATGQQRVNMMMAETPRMMLTEMMMNQTNHLTQPFEMRSRVIPNEVLLQAAATMVQKPAAYDIIETMYILV